MLTTAQRTAAVQALLSAQGTGAFATMTGGQTEEQFIANVVTAMGTQFDSVLTTTLGVLEANAQAQVTSAQDAVTAAQALVTAYTVT